MEEQFVQYFSEEKAASIYLLLIGVFGILFTSLLLKFSNKKWLTGLSYPTSIISVILLAVGGITNWTIPTRMEKLKLMYLGSPNVFFELEIVRIEKVLDNFTYFNTLEIGVMLLGLILCVVAIKSRGFVFGAGLSLLFYGIILFSFDKAAFNRAENYNLAITKYAPLE